MKTLTITKTSLLAVLISSALALSVSGCSDDNKSAPVTQSAKPSHNPNPFDHSHDVPVTDVQKHKFEHEFADQCVARELKNSDDKDSEKERFTKPCTCIATFLMKDLTAQEAEKYLAEHKNPQSLRIKYENAAYHCLQEKTPPHEPDFSHPQ